VPTKSTSAPPGSAAKLEKRGPGRPAGERGGEGQEALLEAARSLLAERGLPRVTVREVARRAGVQPALVNYYFGGKEGLLQAVVARVAGQLLAGVAEGAAVEGSVEERMRALVRAVVAVWAREPYAPRLVMDQVLFGDEDTLDAFVDGYARPNLDTIKRLLETGVESGEIQPVEPLFLVPSLIGSCLFFFLAERVVARLFDLEEVTPELGEQLADHVVDFLFHGISSRPEGGT